jgi:AraC family transcriptional regulator
MSNDPSFRTKEAFKIVGIERYTSNGIPSIREAWDQFGKRSQEIQHVVGPAAHGIEDYSRDFDRNKGGFPKYFYIASLEVNTLADIPAGMVGKEIPSANYAVFSYNGPIDSLHEFFGFIYGEWMPKSGYSMDPKLSLDFERYPERIMDMNQAQIEIWVPVIKG